MTTTETDPLTAMCVWEEMLELRGTLRALDEVWNDCGTAAMRDVALSLCADIEEAFELTGDRFDLPFDWEFVPFVLRLVDWRAGVFAHNPREMAELAVAYSEIN